MKQKSVVAFTLITFNKCLVKSTILQINFGFILTAIFILTIFFIDKKISNHKN